MPRAARTRRSMRASRRCAAIAGRTRSAAALRGADGRQRDPGLASTGDDRVQDPYSLRCQPQVMGACLDLLRQAAATLETEANGVSDNPLVFADTGEVLSGGNFHAEPVAFAADMIALAVCEIGSHGRATHRHADRPRAVGSAGVPDAAAGAELRLHDRASDGGGARIGEQAARASRPAVDSIPTSANQEDHVSMAAHGARRLLRMAANLASVIGIELLAAAQGCDFHARLARRARRSRRCGRGCGRRCRR